ncbi:MAG TPA: DUF6308 family protein [Acidimicrobiales bacterium]|nr:DUF6308 family protein [Acidimicrobiales bacterium]
MADYRPIDPALLWKHLDDDRTARRLADYYTSGRYTGGRFELFAGGGDRPEVADRFTTEDIVAVSLLGVEIPGDAALEVLEGAQGRLAERLAGVPTDLDLAEAGDDAVGPGSAAAHAFDLLDRIPGIAWVTAGKLLARKRPRLIPVYDSVVHLALDRTPDDEFWRPLRDTLRDEPSLVDRLRELRGAAGIDGRVSVIRVLDVAIWMSGRD